LELFNLDSAGNVNSSSTLTIAGNFLPRSAPNTSSTTQMITTVDSDDNVGNFTALAIGADGLPVIAYNDTTKARLRVAKYGNASCTLLVNATTTAQAAADFVGGSIAIGSDSLPILVHHDGAMTVVKCGNSACSAGNTVTAVTLAGFDLGDDTSVAIGADGFPIISVHNLTNGDLQVVKCSNHSCSTNSVATADAGANNTGASSTIAIGTDGRPVIAYYDVTNGDLVVAKCGNISCSSGNTTTTVDAGGNVGQAASLKIGTDGLPVISYYDTTNGNLNVAKCGNISCSSGNTTTTVDSTGNIGRYSSLAVGADGLPVISFYDATNSNLMTAKCGNASCTSGNNTSTLDSTGNVGQYTSLALGNDGLPVISYYDVTNADLKVIKCADPACRNTSGGSLLPGSDLGTRGVFFNNVFAAQFWGKRFQIANFDLAEDYPTLDSTLGAGELVAIDPEHDGYVKRASYPLTPTLSLGGERENAFSTLSLKGRGKGEGDRVVGIVSTEPGLLLTDWTTPHPNPLPGGEGRVRAVPIALAGRVPVKVTAENGPIQPGDYLTLSATIPGAATKAVTAGRVIGSALASFNSPDLGIIPVMVSLGNLHQEATVPLTVAVTNENQLLTSNLDLNNQNIIQVLAINNSQNTWSIDSSGRLIAKEIKTDKLQTKQLAIEANPDPLQSAVGQATILAGNSSVEVKNNLVKPTTKIFITFRTNPNSFWWINKQTEGMFEVGLSQVAPTDLIFDFTFIDVVNPAPTPPSAPTPLSAPDSAPNTDASSTLATSTVVSQ
jgi:hypothetical protein